MCPRILYNWGIVSYTVFMKQVLYNGIFCRFCNWPTNEMNCIAFILQRHWAKILASSTMIRYKVFFMYCAVLFIPIVVYLQTHFYAIKNCYVTFVWQSTYCCISVSQNMLINTVKYLEWNQGCEIWGSYGGVHPSHLVNDTALIRKVIDISEKLAASMLGV